MKKCINGSRIPLYTNNNTYKKKFVDSSYFVLVTRSDGKLQGEIHRASENGVDDAHLRLDRNEM